MLTDRQTDTVLCEEDFVVLTVFVCLIWQCHFKEDTSMATEPMPQFIKMTSSHLECKMNVYVYQILRMRSNGSNQIVQK